jgi:hypothetical protein
MSLKRSDAAIVLEVGRSRCLCLLTLALCMAIAVALHISAIDAVVRLGLMAVALLLTWQEWSRRPELNGRGGTLTLSSDGAWSWRDGQRHLILPLPYSYSRAGHFVALHFKLERRLLWWRSFDLLLCADAVDAEPLRRLRVRLSELAGAD